MNKNYKKKKFKPKMGLRLFLGDSVEAETIEL
jgi:hypothetical protein